MQAAAKTGIVLFAALVVCVIIASAIWSSIKRDHVKASAKRISLPRITGADDLGIRLSPAQVVIVQAFDEKYGDEVGNFTARHNAQWCRSRGYRFHAHIQEPPTGQRPHFLKIHAILHVFRTFANVAGVVYVDGDAIINMTAAEPVFGWCDVVFGNDGSSGPRGLNDGRDFSNAPNTGYIAARNTAFSNSFFARMLESEECAECRLRGCGGFGFKDQGCIDRLLLNAPARITSRFAIADVQRFMPRGRPQPAFLLHWAGDDGNTLLDTIRSRIFPTKVEPYSEMKRVVRKLRRDVWGMNDDLL
tara:strand:+ start:6653 stop:7561 length:909 start_codon:yes stop_codon:yes gene_type:complete